MKHIKLILDFFYKNKIKAFLAIIILMSAMIIFSSAVSQIRYYTISLGYIDKPEFQDGLCLQTRYSLDGYDEKENEKILESIRNIIETAENADCVEGLAGFTHIGFQLAYENEAVDFMLANDFTAEEFKPNLSEGKWLNECEEGDIPNVVLSGARFKNVSVGSDIEIKSSLFKNEVQKFHVIGKISYPYYSYSPSVGYAYVSENGIDKNDLSLYEVESDLSDANSSYDGIFISDNSKTRSLFTDFEEALSNNQSYGDYILAFKEDALDEEKNAFKKSLRALSYTYTNLDGEEEFAPSYQELDGIIAETRTSVQKEIDELIPFNLFAFAIATAASIIVSLLCVKQKQKNDYAAFLCGCSKKKSLLYTFLAILFMVIIPVIIASLYIALVPALGELGIISISRVHFDFESYILVTLYGIFVLLVSFVISSFSIMRKSPIELYKNRLK